MTAHKKGPALGSNTGTIIAQSIQNETLLLKCLFIRPDIFDYLGSSIRPDYFGHLGYGRLFRAMRSGYREYGRILMGRCIFALRAGSGMPTRPSPDGCRFEMMRLLTGWVPWWHWNYYAIKIRESAYRRLVIENAEQNASDAKDPLLSLAEIEARRIKRLQRMEAIYHG